jgi:hypothetical protein
MRSFLRSTAVVVFLLVFAAGAHAQWPPGAPEQKREKKEKKVRAMNTGRFQVFVSPNVKGKTFMLDTETGAMWIIKKDHSTGDYDWMKMFVEGISEAKPKKASKSKKKEDKE